MSETQPSKNQPARSDPTRAARLRRGKRIKARIAQRERDNLLSAWRGLPGNATPATIEHPERLGDTLCALMQSLNAKGQSFERTAAAHWVEIVGDHARASACAVQRLAEDGSLIITVPGAVLRSELQFRKADMLRRIRALPGGNAVRALVFRAG